VAPDRKPVHDHDWDDAEHMRTRPQRDVRAEPVSLYEVHLGSFRRVPEEGDRPLGYRELVHWLPAHAARLGFTHVQILPHPFAAEPFSLDEGRGSPNELAALIDALHRRGLGVVWGNLMLPTGSDEERLIALEHAMVRLVQFHADGLHVVNAAPLLSRGGGWAEADPETVACFRRLNDAFHQQMPGAFTIAGDADVFPESVRPSDLGFDLAWDRRFARDVIAYLGQDPLFRKHHHDLVTAQRMRSLGEPVVLALSHEEMLAERGTPLARIHGDAWQRFANLRLLLSFTFAMPGKKSIFMGLEFGQENPWHPGRSLDWHLIEQEGNHLRVMHLVGELNRLYRSEPSLYQLDADPQGFAWIDAHDAQESVVVLQRRAVDPRDVVVAAFNFTPVVRSNRRIGVPLPGHWDEVLNTDAAPFGGIGHGNMGGVEASPVPSHNRPFSINVTLPPLGAIFLKPRREGG
jgi:1,4-alpha-glucan branching enzyme